MTLTDMPLDRLIETTAALRAAVRYRNPETGARHFCHLKEYRAVYARSIRERRRLIRALAKAG